MGRPRIRKLKLFKKCGFCKKKIYKFANHENQRFIYCSNKCKAAHYRRRFSGKDNPCYIDGRSLSKNKCINCNRDIDRRSLRCYKCHAIYNNPFRNKVHSMRSRKKIKDSHWSKKSYAKSIIRKTRKSNESVGRWIPLNELHPYKLYCKRANWKKRMFDSLEMHDIALLKKFGLFNTYKNTKGVVRDHMYSRYSGFKNRVPPILLRHPANCKVMLHADNLSKAKKNHRYEDGDSITLSQLFNRIKSFKKPWDEQQKCLSIIEKLRPSLEVGRVQVGGAS